MVLRLKYGAGKRHRCETRQRAITIRVGRRDQFAEVTRIVIWAASGVVKMVLQRVVTPNHTRTCSELASNFVSNAKVSMYRSGLAVILCGQDTGFSEVIVFLIMWLHSSQKFTNTSIQASHTSPICELSRQKITILAISYL